MFIVETKNLGQNAIAVDRTRIKCNLFSLESDFTIKNVLSICSLAKPLHPSTFISHTLSFISRLSSFSACFSFCLFFQLRQQHLILILCLSIFYDCKQKWSSTQNISSMHSHHQNQASLCILNHNHVIDALGASKPFCACYNCCVLTILFDDICFSATGPRETIIVKACKHGSFFCGF